MKQMFRNNGFIVVYDRDEDKPLADGFYFTISYPGFTGCQLMEELLYYGVSSVSLDITGSEKEGLRACVSMFKSDQADELNRRLKLFQEHHQNPGRDGLKDFLSAAGGGDVLIINLSIVWQKSEEQ